MQSLQSESAEKCTIIGLSNLGQIKQKNQHAKSKQGSGKGKRNLTLVKYWSMVL